MKYMYSCGVVVVILLLEFSSCSAIVVDYKLNVTSSGPAVYGSLITFQAQMYTGASKTPEDEKLFRYDWRSTVDMLTETQHADFNTSLHRCFDSYVKPKQYRMRVEVYDLKSKTSFSPVAQKDIDFVITSKINGNLKYNQSVHRSHKASNHTFSTQKPVHFMANLTDEFRYSPNFTYKWYVNDKIFEASNTKNKDILIPKAGKHTVRLDAISSGITSDCKQFEYENNLQGSFSADMILKDPVSGLQLFGKSVVNKGENITLMADFSGSAPFSFCWKLVHVSSGGAAVNRTCKNGTEKSVALLYLTEKNLSEVGKYALSIHIENDISLLSRQHSITVNEGPAPKASSHSAAVVLVPVVSVLVVISVLLFGGVFYNNYRRKNLHHIESADFEFHKSIQRTSNEGWFLSNVKEAFRSLFRPHNSDRESWERINTAGGSGTSGVTETRRYGTMVSPVET